jgi:hypothetical protein
VSVEVPSLTTILVQALDSIMGQSLSQSQLMQSNLYKY